MHFGNSEGRVARITNNRTIGRFSRQKCFWPHCHYALKTRFNAAPTTFGHASWKIRGQFGDSNTLSNYQPSFWAKMRSTLSLLCPEDECQQSVNEFRPSMLENLRALRPQWSTIVPLAAFLGKYAYNKIVTMCQNERQRSVNHLCAGISDNLTGMEGR